MTEYGPLVRVITSGLFFKVMVKDDIHPSGWNLHWETRWTSNPYAVVEADQKARALRRSILEGEYSV